MNPFDLKSALLAPHAQHVVVIHFPHRAVYYQRTVRLLSPLEEEQRPGERRVLQLVGGCHLGAAGTREQKIDGTITFHVAMSMAFPQPAPGTAPSPGPMQLPAEKLRRVLGLTQVSHRQGKHAIAIVDPSLAREASSKRRNYFERVKRT